MTNFPSGGAAEEQQVLELAAVRAVALIDAEFDGQAEGVPEFLVVLTALFEHVGKLMLNPLFERSADQGELSVVLKHLARDVERKVLTIDQPLDKAEVFRQKVGTAFHNHDAA